jgi:hypothetical protein
MLPVEPASAGARVTVSIRSEADACDGAVGRSSRLCRRGNEVTLYRRANPSTPPQRVGRIRTKLYPDQAWRWAIDIPFESRQGYLFYASVRAKRPFCDAARSATVPG